MKFLQVGINNWKTFSTNEIVKFSQNEVNIKTASILGWNKSREKFELRHVEWRVSKRSWSQPAVAVKESFDIWKLLNINKKMKSNIKAFDIFFIMNTVEII